MDFQDGLHIRPISRLSFSYSVFKVRSLNFVKFRFQHSTFKCWNLHLTLFRGGRLLFYSSLYRDLFAAFEKRWWAKVDSNHRPHDYQSCALTSWAIGPQLVEISGIEPLTSCLQSRRSPSWAKPPYLFVRFEQTSKIKQRLSRNPADFIISLTRSMWMLLHMSP